MVCEFVRPYQKNLAALALILLVTLRGSETDKEVPSQWVIWNIGQGSWLTRIENRRCHHFDAGGEFKFPYQIVRLCRNLENTIAVSHSDWDHVSFIKGLHAEFPNLCREGPQKPSKGLAKIPECKKNPWWRWRPYEKTKSSNDSSSVYYYKKLLYPGDSPKKFEKQWVDRIPGPVSFLVLAHHGSKTGTSKKLLERLKLKMAVASARRKKYGHPHPLVKSHLHRARVPLLLTEDWGSIHLLD